MPQKRFPAVADRAVREKVKKGRAGIRWKRSRESMKDVGGNQVETLSMEKFRGYNTELKERSERMEWLALSSNVKEEKHLRDYEGSREEVDMKTYLHGPTDYAKTLKLQLRLGDLDLPERNIPIVDRRRKMHLSLIHI